MIGEGAPTQLDYILHEVRLTSFFKKKKKKQNYHHHTWTRRIKKPPKIYLKSDEIIA